jgi:hypothetical protein
MTDLDELEVELPACAVCVHEDRQRFGDADGVGVGRAHGRLGQQLGRSVSMRR